MQKLPLEGIRVLDFTAVWAGPHVTQWLAVMGAEVIKVETNTRPDLTRHVFSGPVAEAPLSAVFAGLNYGKRDCTLNMSLPRARDIARDIARLSDVVAENFGGPVMDRWGLGYADLKEIKPDIIMYAGSGFGRTGPYKESPAFAGIIEAFSGLCSLNSYPGGGPLPLATRGYSDLAAAQHGAFAILTALYHRAKTGEGQYIDLSMTEVMAGFIPEAILDYTMNNRVNGPEGNLHKAMAPHGCYRCAGEDEWVAIAVSSDDDWRSFCNAIGNPPWTADEKFSDALQRLRNRDELDSLVQEWTKGHDHYEAARTLQEAGVMAGPSLKVEEMLADRHLEERGFFVEIDHPQLGAVRLAGLPCKLSDSPPGNYSHAPVLGQDNDYVFREVLKMPEEEIAQLIEEQVIW